MFAAAVEAARAPDAIAKALPERLAGKTIVLVPARPPATWPRWSSAYGRERSPALS